MRECTSFGRTPFPSFPTRDRALLDRMPFPSFVPHARVYLVRSYGVPFVCSLRVIVPCSIACRPLRSFPTCDYAFWTSTAPFVRTPHWSIVWRNSCACSFVLLYCARSGYLFGAQLPFALLPLWRVYNVRSVGFSDLRCHLMWFVRFRPWICAWKNFAFPPFVR